MTVSEKLTAKCVGRKERVVDCSTSDNLGFCIVGQRLLVEWRYEIHCFKREVRKVRCTTENDLTDILCAGASQRTS
jgi:hypothetical protein